VGSAILAAGAAGLGAAIVGTSSPARPTRAPTLTAAHRVPATVQPIHAFNAASVLSLATAPRGMRITANTPIPRGEVTNPVPATLAKPIGSTSAPSIVPARVTSPTVASAAVVPADTVPASTVPASTVPTVSLPAVSVPSLPPAPTVPVSTDAAVPGAVPVPTGAPLPSLPQLP
jgi:hypothetical protein